VGGLTGIETVLLDLDGTLYVGSRVAPGAAEALRWLLEQEPGGAAARGCGAPPAGGPTPIGLG
jgi:hypothetical protein